MRMSENIFFVWDIQRIFVASSHNSNDLPVCTNMFGHHFITRDRLRISILVNMHRKGYSGCYYR